MSQHAINPVIDLIRDGWDDGDKWGSAIGALFAVASVMDAAGIPVPSELEYRRSPVDNRTLYDMANSDRDSDTDTDYDTFVLASEYLACAFTNEELRLAALSLNRYCDMCRAAGLDY